MSLAPAARGVYHHAVRRFLLLVLLLSASCPAQTLTIVHATVIDTNTGKLLPDTTVVIQANRIAGVSPSSKTAPRTGQVLDATGQFLIPGLWDMHTHVYFGTTAKDGSDLILPMFLAFGVTGIRDMGSDLDPILRARAEVASHRMLGPRMIVSGPMLDGAKSTYKQMFPITDPAGGRSAVDLLKSRGVDFIKVQSYVPRDAYFAIADQTKKDNLPLEGHVPDAIRAREAVSSGQQTFEHLIGVFEASSPDENKYLTGDKKVGMFLDTYDPKREAAIVDLLATHHVWQCPTLYWERGQWLVDAVDYRDDPYLQFAEHTEIAEHWPVLRTSILSSLDTDPLPVRERFVAHELGIVRRLHAAGVPFLAGTDTPAGVDVIPGISLHLELQRFVAAGFTPLEALQTATLNPALFLHKLDDYGAVEAGRVADLLLLQHNPLLDITNTLSISAVIADGQYLSPHVLDDLRKRLAKLAATK